jgi:hypothetical protein
MARRSNKLCTVHTVLFMRYDGPTGPAGDGSFTRRFRGSDLAAATDFAAKHTYYGRPCTVDTDDAVPLHLAQRWGVA